MNVIVVIEGREAIPVRAIPFLTNWEKMIPVDVANALAWDKSYRRFKGLKAFDIENVQNDISATWWQNNTCLELKALFCTMKAVNIAYNHDSQDWRRKSLGVLPSGVFVWKDEFEPMYLCQYGLEGESMCDSTELSGLMQEEEQERRAMLRFEPFIPDVETQRLVMEGFTHSGQHWEVRNINSSPWDWWDTFRLHEAACLIAGVPVGQELAPEPEEIPADARPVLKRLISAYFQGQTYLKSPEKVDCPKEKILIGLPRDSTDTMTTLLVPRKALHHWIQAMGYKSAYQFLPSGEDIAPATTPSPTPESQAVPVVAASAPGDVKPISNLPWWQVAYDIHDMAQNIGATRHSKAERTSNTEIAKEIEKRINDIERSKARDRRSPSWDTIRGVLTGWTWRPE